MKNYISIPKATLILHGRRNTPLLGKSAASTVKKLLECKYSGRHTEAFDLYLQTDLISKPLSDIFSSVQAVAVETRKALFLKIKTVR